MKAFSVFRGISAFAFPHQRFREGITCFISKLAIHKGRVEVWAGCLR
jgi:hypothetical protein